jgi:hypothetical protein
MIRLLLSIAFFIAASSTFCAAIVVVAFYRWITRDERRQEPPYEFHVEPYDFDPRGRMPLRGVFVGKPKSEYPRQTVADIVAFNAYRAAKKRGRA